MSSGTSVVTAASDVRGSMYCRAVSLQLHLVIVPIGIWLGGVLVLGGVAERIFAHLPLPRRHRFGRPLLRPAHPQHPSPLLGRSLRNDHGGADRRPRPGVAAFSASYNPDRGA